MTHIKPSAFLNNNIMRLVEIKYKLNFVGASACRRYSNLRLLFAHGRYKYEYVNGTLSLIVSYSDSNPRKRELHPTIDHKKN